GFLQQYQTNATNRNRARARWTYQHFLGIDIENSSTRNIDASMLVDLQGTTTSRQACKSCHDRIDPVAGAFQRYGSRGIYLDGAFGKDTIDHRYKISQFYTQGDTWYRYMLAPGFEGEVFDLTNTSKDPLRILAEHLSQHPKFPEGTIKFWWPALFGEEFLSYKLDDNELQLRLSWLNKLSDKFKSSGFNLKHLMLEIIMSPFFRNDLLSTPNVFKKSKRLLTPEELRNKSLSIARYDDAELITEQLIIYGGIDSYNVERRQRTFSSMMYQIAKRHATEASCNLLTDLHQDFTDAPSNKITLIQSNHSVSASTPTIIPANDTTHYQWFFKNTHSSPINIQASFIPGSGSTIDFEAYRVPAGASWTSPQQIQSGEWLITTDSATPITIETTKIQPNKNSTISYLKEIAFKFWGDGSDKTADDLYTFYLSTHQVSEPNLVETCTSTKAMPAWMIYELARWRLVYIRLMTDFNYLYE
ncbi:MAG: hypothetical protein RL497_1186, partial [Pseudomonadota bacterium]